jgi:hypothetical protein
MTPVLSLSFLICHLGLMGEEVKEARHTVQGRAAEQTCPLPSQSWPRH